MFEALAGVYDQLGFDVIGDEVFRDLVIARIVEPTSLLDTPRVLADLGVSPVSVRTVHRDRARNLVGLKGYVTNIEADIMAPGEVIAKYHELWHVEQSFRMSKTDLRARPMFHRTRDAIEAHLTLVFTALAVAREAQGRTGLTVAKLVKELRPLRSATIQINSVTETFPPDLSADHQTILNALTSRKVTH